MAPASVCRVQQDSGQMAASVPCQNRAETLADPGGISALPE